MRVSYDVGVNGHAQSNGNAHRSVTTHSTIPESLCSFLFVQFFCFIRKFEFLNDELKMTWTIHFSIFFLFFYFLLSKNRFVCYLCQANFAICFCFKLNSRKFTNCLLFFSSSVRSFARSLTLFSLRQLFSILFDFGRVSVRFFFVLLF